MTADPFGNTPAPARGQDYDPLEQRQKTPVVSFGGPDQSSDPPPDSVVTLDIREPITELVHSRDYNTGEPAYWPTKKDQAQGDPILAAVFRGKLIRDDIGRTQTNEDGEAALWAQKPSNLYSAISDAQKAAKKVLADAGKPTAAGRIGACNGGLLHVKFIGRVEHFKATAAANKPKPKGYLAVYVPHQAADPLVEQATPAQPQPVAAPPVEAAPAQALQQQQQAAASPNPFADAGAPPF